MTKYLTEGMVSVQSEGTQVWYRNWRIKLLPQDPLYASLYGSTALPELRAIRKLPVRHQLGFNGSVLTLIMEGEPAANLIGRRLKADHRNKLVTPGM